MSAVRIDESTQCFTEIPFSFVFTKKADMRAINQSSENMWSYDTQEVSEFLTGQASICKVQSIKNKL